MKQQTERTCSLVHKYTREKINTSVAGNITKYNNFHTQESFDKKILTLSNFAWKVFGATNQSDTW